MIQKYVNLIQNPPDNTKGMTRWWWYGCAVTREGIERQLNLMKAAGIGGVEIQILYPVSQDDKKNDIKNIPYFSPEFFDVLGFTAERCRELGMTLDFTLGSSWPYGGPFVPLELAMQCAIPYQIDLHGPCEFKYDLTTRIVGDVACAVMGKMEKSSMLPETVVDITDRFIEKYLFNWPWGIEMEPLQIPEGDWKIVIYVIHRYRQVVRRPAPNTEGYVIDHCSPEALDCFLDNMAQPILDRLGKDQINACFCDSLECDGHNWSGLLLDAFRKRRGYDLAPFSYALWGTLGDLSPDVRYDYFLTMSELTVENFFKRLTDWCHQNHTKSRIQAHGTWGDILQTYAAADIPEGETFGEHDRLECNTIHRRLAASAGHLYGREIISNETFTWLKVPRFIETLGDMKAAVDAVFLDGINMIVNHGYAYSNKKVEKRGWPFYASAHICETNTWWPFYHHLAAYIQKACAILRQGRHYCEVGIYLPQADIWSSEILSDLHLAMKIEEYIGRDTADTINKAGYWFDYLNDESINNLGIIQKGGLWINGNTYKVIILIGCTRLPVETARSLQAFVSEGGVLISTEGIPSQSCGLMDRDQKKKTVQAIMANLFCGSGWHSYGLGKSVLAADRNSSLLTLLKEAQLPDVSIDCNQFIGYIHRVDGTEDLYFTSNVSREARIATLVFKNRQTGFKIIRVETGEEHSAIQSILLPDGLSVTVEYQALESLLFVFSPEFHLSNCNSQQTPHQAGQLTISDWSLRVAEKGFEKFLGPLSTWEQFDELRYYSGAGVYEANFDFPQDPACFSSAYLEIKELHCAARVFVNEIDCGDIWKAPYRLDIRNALNEGTNTIRIEVVNTLINEAIDPSSINQRLPAVIEEWPYFGNVINDKRKEIFTTDLEKAAIKKPMPSGMAGDVHISLFTMD